MGKRIFAKRLMKIGLFTFIFAVLFFSISKIVTNSGTMNYQLVAGFYEEPEDSLDAVYIGASPTYTFWAAPLAWGKYGIAVRPFASQGQPFEAVPYFLKDAVKMQPNALYIISINAINKGFDAERIHWSTDYFPISSNKIKMIHDLSDWGEYSLLQRMEFYLPIIRYHSRWNVLTENDFHYQFDNLKTGMTFANYLAASTDVSSNYHYNTERGVLSASTQTTLDDILKYCDSENLNVLFVVAPQCLDDITVSQFNTMIDTISAHDYPVINMIENVDELGLDFSSDYYDQLHTNIHGAMKYIDYLSQYLIEQYHFEDKRGNPNYESWERSYKEYAEIIAPYLNAEELAIVYNQHT